MSIKIADNFEIFRSTETGVPGDAGDRIPIILGAGRAFGSGDHETTSGCLEELENIPVLPGAKVLDIGCGTGILSVAAARLGARRVIAVDPAPDAITVTRESIKLNAMETKIFPIEGELEIVPDQNFDVILANLYGDILLALVEGISNRLKSGGYLLLSGILYEYGYDLKAAFIQKGCELLKATYHEEYVTLLLHR